eukprot:365778-Chlamydomonas_euryale.AAC.14
MQHAGASARLPCGLRSPGDVMGWPEACMASLNVATSRDKPMQATMKRPSVRTRTGCFFLPALGEYCTSSRRGTAGIPTPFWPTMIAEER